MKETIRKQFSVRDTNVVKGVAIILLLFHHCFLSKGRFAEYDISFFPFTQSAVVSAAQSGKCCVGIFTFLSAYGLTRTYQKKIAAGGASLSKLTEKFVLRRCINLLSGFFVAFVFVFVCYFLFFGKSPLSYYQEGDGALMTAYYVLLDVLGLANLLDAPSMIWTWWYMGLALTVIFLFPLLYQAYQKTGWVLIPALYCLLCSLRLENSEFNRWLVLIPVGILFADRNLLERIKAHSLTDRRVPDLLLKFFLASGVVILLALLTDGGYEGDTYAAKLPSILMAVAVVVWVYLFLCDLSGVSRILEFFGRHSMNIYFVHNFLRGRWFQDEIYGCKHFALVVLVLLAASTAISIVLNALKKYSGYDRAVQKLHQRLDA